MRFAAVLALCAVPLGGCVPMMAASAVSTVAAGARGEPQSNEALRPAAREQCVARARQHGTVRVIDVEQRSVGKIVVWGTVDDGKSKRSFQCDFGTRITGFKLRTIATQPGS